MSTSVISTHEELLRKEEAVNQENKTITLEKPDSSGNSSMPCCPWSKMEGLRDQELSG